jgi:hypothetical protein
LLAICLPLFLFACKGEDDGTPLETGEPDPVESAEPDPVDSDHPEPFALLVTVTLDGDPVEGAVVIQGGSNDHWLSSADGTVTMVVDTGISGEWIIHASHPDARIGAVQLWDAKAEPIEIALTRFDTSDNPAYVFQDPGTPTRNDNTAYCSHCHRGMVDDWFASPHRTSASNPVVQDVYAGTALALSDATQCSEAGGQWWTGLNPGTEDSTDKCYLGDGALPAYNADCGDTAPCDGVAAETGACADCHAPGIDGQLGGRDLHEAVGIAYESGVHCDVCHKVESVDLEGGPGVAGKLNILRPTEEGSIIFDFKPLTFGPYHDVVNPRMGSVHRDHFLGAEFCQGCHEYKSDLAPIGSSVDSTRWPTGLPIQSTFSEWSQGPYSPGAPCQSCHMPPDAEAGNSVDISVNVVVQGIAAGWFRPAGSMRKHVWYGPRQPEARMLQMAGALSVESSLESGTLQVAVTVTNAGAGHAIPTGEAMRSLVLAVEADCDGTPLVATGGDAIPDFGGWLQKKTAAEDWGSWPGAQVGQVIRVLETTGTWHDYPGVGNFSAMNASEKGMAADQIRGWATITAMNGDQVVLDRVLPSGDVAVLGEAGFPEDGIDSKALAGAPGFAFARVMVAPDGRRHVHHSAAVDIASDNRIMPQASWTTHHAFESTCTDPSISAVLVHRAYPLDLARSRGWSLTDSVMVEVGE